MKIIMNLKVIGLVILFAGIMIALCNLLGCFAQAERLEMVQLIKTKGTIPVTAPGFKELLCAYSPPSQVNTTAIVRLGPRTSIVSNGYVTPTGPL